MAGKIQVLEVEISDFRYLSCCLVAFLSYSGYGLSVKLDKCIGSECVRFRNKQNSFNVHHIQYRTERKNERQASIKTTDQGREGVFSAVSYKGRDDELDYEVSGNAKEWLRLERLSAFFNQYLGYNGWPGCLGPCRP